MKSYLAWSLHGSKRSVIAKHVGYFHTSQAETLYLRYLVADYFGYFFQNSVFKN